MTPAVIACALALLGRSQTIAPVHLVAVPPPHASSNVEAFVTAGERAIYLVTSSPAFQDVQREPWTSAHDEGCRKMAGILVHEEWHLQHGPDERGAYMAQLTTLQSLGAKPETINAVRSAMALVIESAARRASALMRASVDRAPR